MKKILFFCLFFLFLSNCVNASEEKSFYIEVYYDVFFMRVWEINGEGAKKQIGDFPVTLTWKRYKLPKKAKISFLELDPVWKPTPSVKARYFQKHGEHLKDEYGPGEEKNAMGAFKWYLEFVDEPGYFMGDNSTRVHEAKALDKICKRDSSGCVRLLHDDGIFLTKLMWGHMDRTIVYTTLEASVDNYYNYQARN